MLIQLKHNTEACGCNWKQACGCNWKHKDVKLMSGTVVELTKEKLEDKYLIILFDGKKFAIEKDTQYEQVNINNVILDSEF